MRSVHSTNKNEMRAINRQICNLVDKYGAKLTGITVNVSTFLCKVPVPVC